MSSSNNFEWIIEGMVCSIITLGFAILIMMTASLCVLGLNIFQGFLLGHSPVYQYGSLELFMFLASAITGVSFVLFEQRGHILMVLPFGFPEMSTEEDDELIEKLHDLERLAWLKEQRRAGDLDRK